MIIDEGERFKAILKRVDPFLTKLMVECSDMVMERPNWRLLNYETEPRAWVETPKYDEFLAIWRVFINSNHPAEPIRVELYAAPRFEIFLYPNLIPMQVAYMIRDFILETENVPGVIDSRNGYPEAWTAK